MSIKQVIDEAVYDVTAFLVTVAYPWPAYATGFVIGFVAGIFVVIFFGQSN